MVEIFISVIIAFLIASGFASKDKEDIQIPEVISEMADEEEDYHKTPTPTTHPIPTPTPTSTPTDQPSPDFSISDFAYPGANITSSSSNSLTLESGDDAGKITDWYKAKIGERHFNAVSFVSTTANNNVSNKLVGDDGKVNINVDISKGSGDSVTKIQINMKQG